MARACVVQRLHFKRAFGGNYMIRLRRWLSATESRSSTCSPGESSCCCSWHPIVTPCAFQHTLVATYQPGVILDAGSLIAMVVKEVVVISGPLFGGVMTIVQLVSVTAGGTQKRYENSIKLEQNTINLKSGVLGTKKNTVSRVPVMNINF